LNFWLGLKDMVRNIFESSHLDPFRSLLPILWEKMVTQGRPQPNFERHRNKDRIVRVLFSPPTSFHIPLLASKSSTASSRWARFSGQGEAQGQTNARASDAFHEVGSSGLFQLMCCLMPTLQSPPSCCGVATSSAGQSRMLFNTFFCSF
jgi:hypothetical protein